MLGFPLPYPQELLYSTIARSGVHDGETSPKQLLDSVFCDRNVIATIDIPSHIEDIAAQYPEGLGLVPEKLMVDHTLWPLYAPFIPHQRRMVIEQWMMSRSHGAAHLSSGVTASRVKQKLALHMCPECVEEQKTVHGEAFWDRAWQVPLSRFCEKHGPLHETKILLNGEHRHAFIDISEVQRSTELNVSYADKRFTVLVAPLLLSDIPKSPTFHQWTQFYQEFATEFGARAGKRIDHRGILKKYVNKWRTSWLQRTHLLPEDKDTSWLKGIFRKHRKSFSFAEHITVIDVLSEGEIVIMDAIQRALSLPTNESRKKRLISVSGHPEAEDQRQWLELISQQSPQRARQEAQALYTRLYRNHYAWLIQVDAVRRAPLRQVNNRVDWNQRDRQAAKKLKDLINCLEEDLLLPRLSKSYLLHQLPHSVTIEKNLDKLPRCRTILKYYPESIAEYQVRRLTVVAIKYRLGDIELKRWSLLRHAGLSEERMSSVVNFFLGEIVRGGK